MRGRADTDAPSGAGCGGAGDPASRDDEDMDLKKNILRNRPAKMFLKFLRTTTKNSGVYIELVVCMYVIC